MGMRPVRSGGPPAPPGQPRSPQDRPPSPPTGPLPLEDPAELLDDYLTAVASRAALSATAVRAGSTAVRALFARAAVPGAGLAELVAAGRAGDRQWLAARSSRTDPAALADLAGVLALQGERRDALGLYDLLLAAFGAAPVPPVHQGLHGQLAYLSGGPGAPGATRRLLRAYRRMPAEVRRGLELDLANPYRPPAVPAGGGAGPAVPAGGGAWPAVPAGGVEPGVGAGRWWRSFRRLLPQSRRLRLDDVPGLPPLDRLTARAGAGMSGPPVSVVVTTYRPGAGLLTALRSLIAQSWTDIEIVLVDDGSPAQYREILLRCAGLDERIRLLRRPVNEGTYRARNAGLDACRGAFVTFQDSDDWSHPARLEHQVRPMLADPDLAATTSEGIFVTDRLLLTRLGARRLARLNPSSLMIRRDTVLRRVGYFDDVRKGADSELIGRIRAAFWVRALAHQAVALALVRVAAGTLSHGEVRAGWLHPARAAYASAYRSWHARIAAGDASAYRPRHPGRRPFAAPAFLRGVRRTAAVYDVVFVTDWTSDGGSVRAAVAEARALTGHGLRVGVSHLTAYRDAARRRRPFDPLVQDLVNDAVVDDVRLTDEAIAGLVVVRRPSVLQFAGGLPGRLPARQVLVVADEAPADRAGTDRRYLPGTCDRAAHRLFAAGPLWCPPDPAVRRALQEHPFPPPLAPFDLPGVVDDRQFVGPRPAGGRAPVVGGDLSRACGPLLDRLAATTVDVRVRGPRRGGRPACWLWYDEVDVSVREYLHQLDFYLHQPGPDTVGLFTRAAVEALAAGCVVLAPPESAAVFGAAAAYGTPSEAAELITRYWADPALRYARAGHARAVLARAFCPHRYADLVTGLLDCHHRTVVAAPPSPLTVPIQEFSAASAVDVPGEVAD